MIALSTAWYPRKKPQLRATLEAIAQMGFEAIEIGVQEAVPFRLKDLEKFRKTHPLKVVSIHNVCTARKLDPSNRRGDWLAAVDEAQRREGVELTLETVELAKKLGASAVVLHLGLPPIEEKWEKQSLLYHLARGGSRIAAEVGVTREEILAEREPHVRAHIEAGCRSLAELLEQSSGVRLGIECRMGWHEFPNLEELGELLRRFPDPRVGYWHDVGHAVVLDYLGLANQYEWLRRHGDRTIGAHLHDVRDGTCDHHPPGLGQVDFEPIRDLLPSSALCVMEINSSFIAEEIVLGRKRLEEAGF